LAEGIPNRSHVGQVGQGSTEPELAMNDSRSFQKRNDNQALVLELITKSGITLLQFIAVYLPCNPS